MHALENMNFPQAFEDWDIMDGTIQDHKDRLDKVLKEVSVVMGVNFIFNLGMLVPLFYTGRHVGNI